MLEYFLNVGLKYIFQLISYKSSIKIMLFQVTRNIPQIGSVVLRASLNIFVHALHTL